MKSQLMPEPTKTAKTTEDNPELSRVWLEDIDRYHKAFGDWEKVGERILKRYRLEQRGMAQGDSGTLGVETKPTYNVLWSNVQTMRPGMFSKVPQIIAERRHRDRDPIGRITAEVIQRAANNETETNGFKDSMDAVVLDVLLPGRGVPWVRFEHDEVPGEATDHERADGD